MIAEAAATVMLQVYSIFSNMLKTLLESGFVSKLFVTDLAIYMCITSSFHLNPPFWSIDHSLFHDTIALPVKTAAKSSCTKRKRVKNEYADESFLFFKGDQDRVL